MVKVRINTKAIERSALAAFKQTCLKAHKEMIKVISTTGDFDGFDGDIVDTGNLRANQQPPVFEGSKATFRNTAEYAVIVHEGATFRAGESWPVRAYKRRGVNVSAHTRTRQTARTVEGRPWMMRGLERIKIQETFEEILAKRLTRGLNTDGGGE